MWRDQLTGQADTKEANFHKVLAEINPHSGKTPTGRDIDLVVFGHNAAIKASLGAQPDSFVGTIQVGDEIRLG